ncbi:MAG: lytic transglycosylase domain-containing protein [Thermoanaerobaculia bacterium]|nr:lytic transglycosylase domain-containing protein [Thermoanaerobaculia bacterium]
MTEPGARRSTARRGALALLAIVLAHGARAPLAAETIGDPTPAAFTQALDAVGPASRAGGYAAAERLLAPWSAAGTGESRTLLGLLAFVHDRFEVAAELLADAGLRGELDDWRLWALAEARAAQRQPAAAGAALDALLAERPDSPLAARAVVRRVELALEAGETELAARRLAAARGERLAAAERVALEQLAWRLALDRGDTAMLVETARHLLVLAPLEASRLRVVDVVAARRAAASDWRLWLAAPELERRAQALIDVDLPAGALTTLAAVPPEQRTAGWALLEARALVAAGRGTEAYAALAGERVASAELRGAVEWERARAARAAAVPGAARERWLRLEREHLLAAARAGDGELAGRALERLATGYLEDRRIEEAVAALRQLLALRAQSTTGARPLWEHGWEAYDRGDTARAVAVWRQLAELYPRTPSARSGRYWTARALEQRGDDEAARALYREILAADTADFYARQAGLRLAGARRATVDAPPERERWPESLVLARAARLSHWGLDRLAQEEIALVAARAEPRAAAALRAVVLARSGERRASLGALREAFPELGTAHQARVPDAAIELYYPVDYRDTVARAAAREGLSASLVLGMIHQESAFDAAARSRSGARGLMQLMPSTGQEVARRLGLPFSTARLNDPETSVRLGTHYFRQMLDRFDGNVELALAGYNGGPGRISRLWRAAGPSPELDRFLEGLAVSESKHYVKRILVLADSYRSLYPDLG